MPYRQLLFDRYITVNELSSAISFRSFIRSFAMTDNNNISTVLWQNHSLAPCNVCIERSDRETHQNTTLRLLLLRCTLSIGGIFCSSLCLWLFWFCCGLCVVCVVLAWCRRILPIRWRIPRIRGGKDIYIIIGGAYRRRSAHIYVLVRFSVYNVLGWIRPKQWHITETKLYVFALCASH